MSPRTDIYVRSTLPVSIERYNPLVHRDRLVRMVQFLYWLPDSRYPMDRSLDGRADGIADWITPAYGQSTARWVAMSGDYVVGFASVATVAPGLSDALNSADGIDPEQTLEINRLVVHPNFSRQGLGHELLAEAEAWIQGTGRARAMSVPSSSMGGLRLALAGNYRRVAEYEDETGINYVMFHW